jgi:phage terminase large subunit GpA-like protein
VEWEKIEYTDLDGAPKVRPKNARYVCAECGAKWTEAEKRRAVDRGRWKATGDFDGVAGFRVSALYSKFETLDDLAKKFYAAKENVARLRVFTNTSLAETFEENAEQIDEGAFMSRREDVAEPFPSEICYITAGADVQSDRIECLVVGWGDGEVSWRLDFARILGDTRDAEVWSEFGRFLEKTYETQLGVRLRISKTFVDSGYRSDMVYRFVARRPRVFASKGYKSLATDALVISKNPTKKAQRYGTRVVAVAVDELKQMVHDRATIDDPDVHGYMHFTKSICDREYFAQLFAERRVVKYSGRGEPKRVWTLPSGARNEALDMEVYALAAMKSNPSGVDFAAIMAELEGIAGRKKRGETSAKRKPYTMRRIPSFLEGLK